MQRCLYIYPCQVAHTPLMHQTRRCLSRHLHASLLGQGLGNRRVGRSVWISQHACACVAFTYQSNLVYTFMPAGQTLTHKVKPHRSGTEGQKSQPEQQISITLYQTAPRHCIRTRPQLHKHKRRCGISLLFGTPTLSLSANPLNASI